ncbi:PRC-barrel domain-containing protein [Aquabacter sediminis]|uniref:PRC-barrel domain-containing protein n=1 Tax=Aquabacter sediminis TaxID=3029197 RepID=UPI00237D4C22|nr:PRC-barrel domain-containing protein [Aquabacter sp. P-9]MDE1568954.1 PRC-barrel domain-containing protein [Aquabacter sp. P-9]
MKIQLLLTSTLAALLLAAPLAGPARADDGPQITRREGGAHTQPVAQEDGLTPQQRMERRFPQKARVGDLIGQAVLDFDDRTLGFVTEVARTPEGGLVLVMPYGGWFGLGGRPVGVPLEAVASLGRHINLLDLDRADLAALPDWMAKDGTPLAANETIRIAISRR